MSPMLRRALKRCSMACSPTGTGWSSPMAARPGPAGRRSTTASAAACCMRHRHCSRAGYDAVCLLNSDSPTLPTSLLADAAGMLAAPGDRVVLGACDDGGYYLIGMKAPHARLFADIAWSTEQVADQTAGARRRTRASSRRIAATGTTSTINWPPCAACCANAAKPASGACLAYPAPATSAASRGWCAA